MAEAIAERKTSFKKSIRKSAVKYEKLGETLRKEGQITWPTINLSTTIGVMIFLILSHSILRTPRERIACKNVFFAMQLARMRAISTGNNAYIDFNMDGEDVSDKYYTVYLGTDNGKDFGEKNNANGESEFTASHFVMQDSWQN